jgi:uncharacterized peroxidase-related enzyme
MSFFSRLDAAAGPLQILQMNKAAGRALIDYHEAVLRQPSALTVGERELIAALVSGLNSCDYCYGVHAQTAAAFGIDEALIEAMVRDLDAAPVPEKLRPVLQYAKKLTLSPSKRDGTSKRCMTPSTWSACLIS